VGPELRALSDRTDATLREIVRMAVARLEPADVELAVEDAYALVDGLALHAVIGSSSPETMQRVLRATLSKLTHSGA
jgi:hypothetical protein